MTKKNGGKIPVCNDERQKYVWIPCKQCYICRAKKGREWRMRITEDIKVNKNAKIITLTFNTESLRELAKKCKGVEGYELDNQICKLAVKRFRERWRKKYGRSPRHWLITELGHGKTEHVHMHGIIWEDERYKLEDTLVNEVEKIWGYGYVGKYKKCYKKGYLRLINYVDARTANYFTKYVTKVDEMHPEYKQIILTSAGIGKAYTESIKAQDNKFKGKETNQLYNIDTGGVLPMPEYFRKKLYTDEQREQLTSEYLDRRITYIEGKEIRLDIGDSAIFRLYKGLREKNARLGFGSKQKNWARKRFENIRRKELHKQRFLEGTINSDIKEALVARRGASPTGEAFALDDTPEWVTIREKAMQPNEKFYEQKCDDNYLGIREINELEKNVLEHQKELKSLKTQENSVKTEIINYYRYNTRKGNYTIRAENQAKSRDKMSKIMKGNMEGVKYMK